MRQVALYNHQLPQSALKSSTPMQVMKEWHHTHPHLFHKRPYDRPGCDTYGRIDVLVNNAGIFSAADFLDVTEADFDAVLRVNLKGSFLVGQAVARAMVASGGGSIVNMSSVNGVLAIPNISSYNVSKGGVNQLTRVMALALADKNIRVNAVAPGTIATELAAKAVLTSDEAKKKIMSRTPMKRLGEPSEIADVVAWLASDAASYVTGEIVTVDGGRMTLNYTVPV